MGLWERGTFSTYSRNGLAEDLETAKHYGGCYRTASSVFV